MKRKLFIFLTLLIFLFCFNACNNHQKNNGTISTDVVENPNTANGKSDLSELPVFSFNTEEHDFGKITQGVKVTYTFKFKNTGNVYIKLTRLS